MQSMQQKSQTTTSEDVPLWFDSMQRRFEFLLDGIQKLQEAQTLIKKPAQDIEKPIEARLVNIEGRLKELESLLTVQDPLTKNKKLSYFGGKLRKERF